MEHESAMEASSYTPENEADDSCVFIQADKLQTLMSAAKVQDVEPIWTSVFAKALEGKDIKELLTNIGSAGPAAPAGGAAAPAEGAAEGGKKEEKEEEKEESDEDMGFGLFD
ncbi:hypothetical protein PHISP_02470 [Aspergillus sp. HF37]|nr:hypothetical protein PHISP_02470 [Aspergillus sp. HF37]